MRLFIIPYPQKSTPVTEPDMPHHPSRQGCGEPNYALRRGLRLFQRALTSAIYTGRLGLGPFKGLRERQEVGIGWRCLSEDNGTCIGFSDRESEQPRVSTKIV